MVYLLSDGLEKFAPSVTLKSGLKKCGQFTYNKDIAEAKQVRRQLRSTDSCLKRNVIGLGLWLRNVKFIGKSQVRKE